MDLLEWGNTHARRGDPPTSVAASRSSKHLASDHQREILAFLKSIAPEGATIEEVASGTTLDKFQVARRTPELESAGHARTIGERRLSTGRMGRVWFQC